MTEVVPTSTPAIVNVSSTSVELTVELAKHVYKIGCSAIASLLPLHYSPGLIEIIDYEYLSRVEAPLIICNNPHKRGYDIAPQIFESIVSKATAVKGMKYSGRQLDRI